MNPFGPIYAMKRIEELRDALENACVQRDEAVAVIEDLMKVFEIWGKTEGWVPKEAIAIDSKAGEWLYKYKGGNG